MAAHGSPQSYKDGCRCDECRWAMSRYNRDRPPSRRDQLADALNELFPYGLTDDCPWAQGRLADRTAP